MRPTHAIADACRESPVARARRWSALLAALIAAQALLIANPGYFSHDELQWAAQAMRVPRTWVAWFDTTPFQYRPLTFNLWLVLSQALFETPRVFHAVLVLLGSMNAVLLAAVLRRAGLGFGLAAGAALVFVLNPFAAYVHGWVATLADVLWVGLALALMRWLQARARGDAWTGAVACAVTALALLAKEAAIVLPALLLLAALLAASRRVWFAAAIGSGVAVMVYLALRIGPLLQGAQPGSGYGWSLAQMPLRWLEYQGFAWVPTLFEIQSIARASSPRLLVVALVALGIVWALWRASPRLAVAWIVGSAAALGPVLILAQSANQYGYGMSALLCGLGAVAWPRTSRAGRVVLAGATVLMLWHGINVQRELLRAGHIEANFSPSLAEFAHLRVTPMRLEPEDDGDRWLYTRLLHDVPSYRGAPIDPATRLVEPGEAATHRIAADGHIVPLAAH